MSNKKREEREARFKAFGENFRAKLIGIDTVEEARGDKMCLDTMGKLKALVKTAGEHKQQIIVNVSLEGIKIIDLKSLANLHTHDVIKISFISRDPTDKRAFGYIYGEAGNHKFYAIKTQNQADELVIALKDLFEIVLSNKQKEVEEQKKRMEESTVYLEPSYDNPLGSPTSKAPAEENVYSESPITLTTAEPQETAISSLVSLENEVSNLQMGITAMEQLDLNSPDADPFSPGAVLTSSTTADPFAPATSPPLQPPPPLRPPQAVPRAAPRQAPAPVVPPAAAPVQPAPSADLFGEVQVQTAPAGSAKPSDDLFKEFKDTFTAPPQPAAAPASTNPFGGGMGGFGVSQPGMGGGFQQQPFSQAGMGMGQAPMGMGQPAMGFGQAPMGMGQAPMGMGQAPIGQAPMGMQQQPQQRQDLFGSTATTTSNSFDAFTLQPQQVHPKPVEKNGQAKKPDPFGSIGLLGQGPETKDPKKKDPFAGFKMAKPGEVKVPEFNPGAAPNNNTASGNLPPVSLDLTKTFDITDDFSLPSPQGPPPPLPVEILSHGISLKFDDVVEVPPPPPRRSRSSLSASEGTSPLPIPPRVKSHSFAAPNLSVDSAGDQLRTTPVTANLITAPSLTRNPSSLPSNLASLDIDNNLHGNDEAAISDLASTHSNSTGNLSSPGREQSPPVIHNLTTDNAIPTPHTSLASPTGTTGTMALSNSLPSQSPQSSCHNTATSSMGVSIAKNIHSSRMASRLDAPLSDNVIDILSSSAPVPDSFLMHRQAHHHMTTSSSNPSLSKLAAVPIIPVADDPFADDPFLRGSPTVKKVFVLPPQAGPQVETVSNPTSIMASSSASFSSPSSSSLSSTTYHRTFATVNTTHQSNGSNDISGVRTDPFGLGDVNIGQKPADSQPLFDDSPFGAFDFGNPSNK
ncbi:uncharacterized protein [Asterias amurensis]